MELRDYTDADAWFTERLETDSVVMAELGGAVAPFECNHWTLRL